MCSWECDKTVALNVLDLDPDVRRWQFGKTKPLREVQFNSSYIVMHLRSKIGFPAFGHIWAGPGKHTHTHTR